MIVGLHCMVREGYAAALGQAKQLALPVMQMLPYKRHEKPEASDLQAFRKEREASGIRLLAHSRFVPSLASSDPKRRASSVRMLAEELRLSEALGAEAFVLHATPYSPGSTVEEGMRLFGESVAAGRVGSNVPVLLENVPGGGRRMGATLEELGALGGHVDGFCLDTAHAWAAGYDVATAEGMLKFLSKAHRFLGSDRVRAFHLNDTEALLGSNREHHASWGTGRLGTEGLKVLLDRQEYAEALGILETPRGEDVQNLAFVRRLTGS